MCVISVILLVVFVIVCILLVALVLLQNEEGGMGGLLGGGGSQAFGSRSANVLTKTTYVLVTLFFITSFGLAFVNKTPAIKSLDAAAQQSQENAGSGEWWNEEETVPETSAQIDAQ